MKMKVGGGGGGGGGEKKMSLEEYVDFFISEKSIDFTIPYLNQILHMHGFRKLHRSPKEIVGGAVDALDLLDLSRSTLKQSAVSSSPSSSLTLEHRSSEMAGMLYNLTPDHHIRGNYSSSDQTQTEIEQEKESDYHEIGGR